MPWCLSCPCLPTVCAISSAPSQHASVLEQGTVDAQHIRVRPDKTLRGFGRFLHHGAKLPRERQTCAFGQQRGFDVEHIATGLRPRQACGNARWQLLAGEFNAKTLRSEHLWHVFRADRHRLGLAFSNMQGDLPRG